MTEEQKLYHVWWDNGKACGDLPEDYTTVEEARAAGEAWYQEMIAADPEGKDEYGFGVVDEEGEDQ